MRDELPAASEPRNTPPLVAGPSPGAEASTATQDNNNTPAAFGDGASAAFPPVAEPAPESKAPTPGLGTTSSTQDFREITPIKTPAVVLQARLISGSRPGAL